MIIKITDSDFFFMQQSVKQNDWRLKLDLIPLKDL